MRDIQIIETELMEISAIADDTLKFERIVAWCATHPDEIPFALTRILLARRDVIDSYPWRVALSSTVEICHNPQSCSDKLQ